MINKKNKKLKEWEKIALKAMKTAFDTSGMVINNLDPKKKKIAIDLFYQSIDNMNADLAWPYIKLVDLIDDQKEKIKLHIRAYKIEDNIYSIKFLFKQIIQDYPEILSGYLK